MMDRKAMRRTNKRTVDEESNLTNNETPEKRARVLSSEGASCMSTRAGANVEKDVHLQEITGPVADPESNKHMRIIINTSEYRKVFRSDAFVDKSEHLKSLFSYDSDSVDMKTILFVAPFRCGKSTNLNMNNEYMKVVVDKKGDPIQCVSWSDGERKWIEVPKEHQTEGFKLFKKLKIYKCQHLTPLHTEAECNDGICDNRKAVYECLHTRVKHTHDECEKQKCQKHSTSYTCQHMQALHDEAACIEGKCAHRNFFYQTCGQHPVIYIDLKDVKYNPDDLNELWEGLSTALCYTFKQHEYLKDGRSKLDSAEKEVFSKYVSPHAEVGQLEKHYVRTGLKFLAACLKKQFGKEVFVMVDEYDSPLLRLLESENSTKAQMKTVTDTIGRMLSTVLKGNTNVSGGLVNACLDVQGTLTAYANNVKSVRFLEHPQLASYCGFTHDDVVSLLNKHAFRNLDGEKLLGYYNGYKMLGTPTKIYNTYSVVMYLHEWNELREMHRQQGKVSPTKEDSKPHSFWKDRGIEGLDRVVAIDAIRQKLFNLMENGHLWIDETKSKLSPAELFHLKTLLNREPGQDPTDVEVQLFFHYLRHRGYLYVTSAEGGKIRLEVPNLENSHELRCKLWSSDYYRSSLNVKPVKYLLALKNLDKCDTRGLEELAKSVVEMFPSKLPLQHDELKGVLYSFVFQNQDKYGINRVESEPFVLQGRKFQADLLICKTSNTGIIIEIASGKKNEESALNQIFERKYYCGLEGMHYKMYIGLRYDFTNGNVNLCATSGNVTSTKKAKLFRCSAERCVKGSVKQSQRAAKEKELI